MGSKPATRCDADDVLRNRTLSQPVLAPPRLGKIAFRADASMMTNITFYLLDSAHQR